MSDKQNLLVSFSGGETSAYMAWWIHENWREKFNIVFVFANTGQENPETIDFVKSCSDFFGFRVHIVESVVHKGIRKGSTHKEVKFDTLSMNGEPFEAVISKYGIPNKKYPHCNRELKLNPITSFAKEYFKGEKYLTAIGIRVDEIDRVSSDRHKKGLIYPLIENQKMTKPKINFWWSQQPFRLKLKGYQGNCKACWKKSYNKLLQIAKESPEKFEFMARMEIKYGNYIPESRDQNTCKPITFFRENRSAKDILDSAATFIGNLNDDSVVIDDTESCDLFSGCSDF